MARLGKKRFALVAAFFICSMVLLGGCADELASLVGGTDGFGLDGAPSVSDEAYVRPAPVVEIPQSPGTHVVSNTSKSGDVVASLDLSSTSQGFAIASCKAASTVMVLVDYTGQDSSGRALQRSSQYVISNDGSPHVIPLPESGYEYSVSVNVKIEGTEEQYSVYVRETFMVNLESEFAPFLIPNMLVDYDGQSDIVAFSYDLTKHCETKLEIAQQVYYWITHNVVYDESKAEAVSTRALRYYDPLPDAVLADKDGICYDYASLAAAMLRANGIPCKLVKGWARSGSTEVYHAWNEIWLEETGWIAVKVPTTPKEWMRIDTTFAAGGASEAFVGDGSNYYAETYH